MLLLVMEMLNVKFMKHRLKAMDNGQYSKFLRLYSQFSVLRATEMQKAQFYCMANDGKWSEDEL